MNTHRELTLRLASLAHRLSPPTDFAARALLVAIGAPATRQEPASGLVALLQQHAPVECECCEERWCKRCTVQRWAVCPIKLQIQEMLEAADA